MGTSLIIGGTGMLASASEWLAQHSTRTIMVARNASRFANLHANMLPVDANWNQPDFAPQVGNAIHASGNIQRALIWMHDPDKQLPPLLPLLESARIVLVLGSRDGKPSVTMTHPSMTTVQLGSMATASGRRWLTHAEISDGAIEALTHGRSLIVGELRPA